ncbi:uncharacterized protein LOC114130919 isoform X2 [Aphis gossypii]|uniref:uncharacterized protein LOC114130919 isoform X2 n=1 Tax=Aphis gossypii TaxID=80765 RepID=UPI00215910DD|nr:uncharacterized protein LOC114130919 isoform X2 [Aphis gossypii]
MDGVKIICYQKSDMTCNITETILCKHLTEICYYNEECCSQYCLKSFPWFYGICEQFSMQFNFDSNSTAEKGICEFHMQTDESDIDYLDDEFGNINAAHNSLPPYTLIQVSHEKRSIIVTINDRIPRTNGTLLDLSNEAALKLQIKNEGFAPCKIEKVIHHNPILKMILYAIPIFSCVIIVINIF